MFRTYILVLFFLTTDFILEISDTASHGEWDPNKWLGKEDKPDSEEEDDINLCYGYPPSQERICDMILTLTRESKSSLGVMLQEAVDKEAEWCTNTLEAHQAVLTAELELLQESLNMTKSALLILANREHELEVELDEANKRRDILQKKLDEMTRDQENYLAEKQKLKEELEATKNRISQLDSKIVKLKNDKEKIAFHFKRVMKENEALVPQLRSLQEKDKSHVSNTEICDVQRARITKLELELKQTRSEILEKEQECSIKLNEVARAQQTDAKMREECIRKQTELAEVLKLSKQRETESNRNLRLAEHQENEAKTKIINLESQVEDLERKLQESKHSHDKCIVEGNSITVEKQKSDAKLQTCTLENLKLEEEKKNTTTILNEKVTQLEECLAPNRPPKKRVPPQGSVRLVTGTYLFQSTVGGKFLAWDPARDYCRSLDMDLVAIESPEENEILAAHGRKLDKFKDWMAWTSGCYTSEQKKFVWQSTGAPLIFNNWFQGRGPSTNSSCIGLMSKNSKWIAINPTTQIQPFICEF